MKLPSLTRGLRFASQRYPPETATELDNMSECQMFRYHCFRKFIVGRED